MAKKLMTLGLVALLAACSRAPMAAPQDAANLAARSQVAHHSLKQQVLAARAQRFKALDRNQDGRLTQAESGLAPEVFAGLDHEGQGALTQAALDALGPSVEAQVAELVSLEVALKADELSEGVESFRPLALGVPAAAPPPIILLPGYLDLELYFVLIKRRLTAAGRTWRYLDLFPNVADIHGGAQRLSALVDRTLKETGAQQVDLLGHSMGGLISRTYLKALNGVPKVNQLITMATPHHGTYVSHLGPGAGADQMNPGSSFIAWVNAPNEEPLVPTTSVRAGLDEIVIPHDSAILKGADNHLAPLAMHGTILVSRKAWKPVAKALGL